MKISIRESDIIFEGFPMNSADDFTISFLTDSIAVYPKKTNPVLRNQICLKFTHDNVVSNETLSELILKYFNGKAECQFIPTGHGSFIQT